MPAGRSACTPGQHHDEPPGAGPAALSGLPDGFHPQLGPASGGGVRLGGQQPRVDVGGFPATARPLAQLGAIRGLALAEQQVIRAAVDHLARLQA